MKARFNLTSFISIGLLFSFLIMLFSGIILFIAPEGSISRWMGWKVLGLTKNQWENQHTIFSYLFVVFGMIHIFIINWQLMVLYFRAEKFRLVYLKELILIFCITVFVFAGTNYNYQPFNWILDSGKRFSECIGKNVEIPDIANPENLSLNDFAEDVLIITYESLAAVLKENGFQTIDQSESVEVFCKQNKITPEELYKLIKSKIN